MKTPKVPLRSWIIALAACLIAFGVLLAPTFYRAEAQVADPHPVLLIDIEGAIGFVAAEHLSKAIDKAAARGSPALVVRLDTPGGLLSSTREMIQKILASKIPIVMYTAPGGARAASAGTYLMYAAHVAAMAPGTHVGAATPIAISAPGLPGPSAPKKPAKEPDKPAEPGSSDASAIKTLNDAVAYMRTLAELRGRNADWGEKAVRDAATLTATAALEARVIDLVATDIDDLLTKADGRTVKLPIGDLTLATKGRAVIELQPDWKMQIMSVITDPNLALILLIIGLYGILFEFWSPGSIAPGVIGAISLLMGLTALSVLPVNFAGLALLVFGIGLMVSEAYVPGFGLLGVGGIVAFAIGALFLFDPAQSDIPIRVSWQAAAGMTALSAAFFVSVLGLTLRSRRLPVRTGSEELIGSIGEVINWDQGAGHLRIHGEVWSAQSNSKIEVGRKVRVIGLEGLTLIIEPKT